MPQLLLQATPLPLFYPLEEGEDRLASEIAMATRQDEDGDSVLHIAVVRGEEAVVRRLVDILLRGGRHLDIFNNLRQTPLHLAVITHQPELVGLLLRGGADPCVLDRHGQTSAHLCCEHGQTDCLRRVLTDSPHTPDLEARNYEGLTPLHLAVQSGSCELVKLLLDSGADIDAVDIKSGRSPLIHAVENNNMEMVNFLIKCGASVNAQSYSGNSALHSACGRGLVEAVRLLLRNGADSSLKNYHNDTALMVAKNKRVTDVLRGKGGRHLNPKPLEPPPDAPSPHSLSPSPHQHSADGTPAQSPGHAPLRSPLAAGHHVAPPPAPSPSHQTAVAPPTRSPISQSAEAERRLSPVETQEHAQQEHKRLKEDVPGNRTMTIPRVQFQFFPLGGGGYPSPLRDAVALPVAGPVPLHAPYPPAAAEFPKGYYIEPQYTSFLPLPPSLAPLPLVPAPLSHGLPPHPPVSLPRPSSRGSDSQSDASSMSMSSEGKGES
ncbi:BCL3 protein, partial [Atractosteus spatula]|nr:BCL3 protein [Atractosteus spatula]